MNLYKLSDQSNFILSCMHFLILFWLLLIKRKVISNSLIDFHIFCDVLHFYSWQNSGLLTFVQAAHRTSSSGCECWRDDWAIVTGDLHISNMSNCDLTSFLKSVKCERLFTSPDVLVSIKPSSKIMSMILFIPWLTFKKAIHFMNLLIGGYFNQV